jgi:hypothetical protein
MGNLPVYSTSDVPGKSIAYSSLDTHANGHTALAVLRSYPANPVRVLRC